MSKKVLILSASPRKGGNSDTLCDAFAKGAAESGHQVEKVFLGELHISPCVACYICKSNGGVCAIEDDMAGILERMQAAHVIVMASPVYFGSISAQMKMVLDRSLARSKDLKGKEFYYIMTGVKTDERAMDCTLDCFRGYAACLPESKELGVLEAKGVYQAGEIHETDFEQLAYEWGKQLGKV